MDTTVTVKYTRNGSGGGITIPSVKPTYSDAISDFPEPIEPQDVAKPDDTANASDATGNIAETQASHPGQVLASTQTVTHEYLTLSGKVVRETVKTNNSVTYVLDFLYDESGRPFALNYSTNGGSSFITYYYILNLQGDVVKLVTSSGSAVATYEYDAWGNILPKSGSMAYINPLRYRGYYYDSETGFYYLQSRYYDPANYRFVSADSYTTTELADPLSANMFAYCSNNPVMRTDPTGEAWWHWVVAAVAVTALVVVSVATCGGAAAAIGTAASIVTGTCSTVSAGATIATGAAMGAGIAFAGSVVTAATTSDSLDEFAAQGETALINTAIGAGGGALAGYANSVAYCFVAGTLVVAENGNVPIEQIKVGDFVWAWDEKTDDVALKQVVETYINETTELTHVFVNGEEIIATPTHPFYCPTKGWTDAARLRAGDILVLVNGEYVVVEKVQHELLERPIKVYNFQVEEYHTYYVSDNGVLVHNDCPQRLVAGDKNGWNARVSEGGLQDHNPPHAHIFYKNNKLGSVNALGEVIKGADKIGRKGLRFVAENSVNIIAGIKKWWIAMR